MDVSSLCGRLDETDDEVARIRGGLLRSVQDIAMMTVWRLLQFRAHFDDHCDYGFLVMEHDDYARRLMMCTAPIHVWSVVADVSLEVAKSVCDPMTRLPTLVGDDGEPICRNGVLAILVKEVDALGVTPDIALYIKGVMRKMKPKLTQMIQQQSQNSSEGLQEREAESEHERESAAYDYVADCVDRRATYSRRDDGASRSRTPSPSGAGS